MTIVSGNEFQKYLNIVTSCTLEFMNRCFIGSRSILVSRRRGWGGGGSGATPTCIVHALNVTYTWCIFLSYQILFVLIECDALDSLAL